jgi:cytochrome c-type biogenesis protein CcmF
MVLVRGAMARRGRTGEGGVLAFWRSLLRDRRRYGAHVAHLGLVLMAIGVTGSSLYQDEVRIALAPGESVDVHGYTILYREFVVEEHPDRYRFAAEVDVLRGGRLLSALQPEKNFYWNVEQWVSEVAIRTTPLEDLYLVLAGFERDGLASFEVLANPLVMWLWIGGIVLMLGGTLAWWPPASERQGAAGAEPMPVDREHVP